MSVTLKGRVLAELIAANPRGRLKAVEYDSFGGLRRVEWHHDYDDAEAAADVGPSAGERQEPLGVEETTDA